MDWTIVESRESFGSMDSHLCPYLAALYAGSELLAVALQELTGHGFSAHASEGEVPACGLTSLPRTAAERLLKHDQAGLGRRASRGHENPN